MDLTISRHPKPPYSYSSIIMLALLTEETRQLPLRKIIERLVLLNIHSSTESLLCHPSP